MARIAALALLALWAAHAAATEGQPDYTAPYILLTDSPEKLLERVNQAAAHGYRILTAAPFALSVLMEKTAAAPDAARYLSAGWPNGKDTLDERLNAVGASGYRLVPGTSSWAERDPQGRKWEYRVLVEPPDSAVHEALRQGYEIADVLILGKGVMFFERPVAGETGPSQAPPRSPYLALDATEKTVLQKKLSDAAALGYRVHWVGWGGIVLNVSRADSHLDARMVVGLERGTSATPSEYLVLAKKSPKRLEEELNAAGTRGFRLFPKALFQRLLILEKVPGETQRYEYRLVEVKNLSAGVRPAPAGPAKSFQAVGLLGDVEMDLPAGWALPIPSWPVQNTSTRLTIHPRATNIRVVMERPLP